ncbi:hypothetical protein FISHEDRAFT_41932 [Fistulina hepatica ATCC 64428]|nr:hypothetical protein FISHEDRAFT_41932 [Fistulina hepatica ATCC 64428]
MRKIDVHHHFFPDFLDKGKAAEDVGWRTPPQNLPWTPEKSIAFMDAAGIDVAILSFPAVPTGAKAENRHATRSLNVQLRDICVAHPTRFGFFASLPVLDDVEGVLAEIDFALDYLGADGFALPSSSGVGRDAKYIAHETYAPIWDALNLRQAVVFLHGTQTPSSTPYPHPFLGLPVVEVPNETFKAAAHLVVSGFKRRYDRVKIILAHMGGSMPFLAPRVAALSSYMMRSAAEIMHDFRTFYFDTALSAETTTLTALHEFLGPAAKQRMLFGSDFPGKLRKPAIFVSKLTALRSGRP